jgi:hypothetical protein
VQRVPARADENGLRRMQPVSAREGASEVRDVPHVRLGGFRSAQGRADIRLAARGGVPAL